MNDELRPQKRASKTLDERFARRPHTYRRLQEIADQMDQAIADGATADAAEAMAMEQIQKLGGEMLQGWAEAKQQQALAQAQAKHPQSIKHIKKK
jgi:Skp family chaperone for outer membrane proteins